MNKAVTIVEVDMTYRKNQYSTRLGAPHNLCAVVCQSIRSIIRNEDQILIICSRIDTYNQHQ